MDTTRPAQHVVVGIGSDEQSRPALAYAIHLALLRRIPLEILRFWDGDEQRARRDLGAASVRAERVINGAVPVHGRTTQGPAVRGLVDASATAAVVVVGHRRHGDPRGAGSIAAKVAGQAHAPVVIVPSVWAASERTRRVTVGVGDVEGSAHLLEEGFRMAELEGDEVAIVHVWRPRDLRQAALARVGGPGWEPIEECDRRAMLEKVVSVVAESFPGVRHCVELDPALVSPAEVLAEASEWSVLVVVGRHDPVLGHGEPESVIEPLADRALCPILVVPPDVAVL